VISSSREDRDALLPPSLSAVSHLPLGVARLKSFDVSAGWAVKPKIPTSLSPEPLLSLRLSFPVQESDGVRPLLETARNVSSTKSLYSNPPPSPEGVAGLEGPLL